MTHGSPSGIDAIPVRDFTAWLDLAAAGDRIVYATRNYRLRPEGGGPSAFVLDEARKMHDEGRVNLFQRRIGPHPRGQWTDGRARASCQHSQRDHPRGVERNGTHLSPNTCEAEAALWKSGIADAS